MNLTAKRLQWLRRLAIEGSAERDRTSVGFSCMQAGWTEWNYVYPDGKPTDPGTARERYGDEWWNRVECKGERLTEAGRAILEQQP